MKLKDTVVSTVAWLAMGICGRVFHKKIIPARK
jgi:hypothetical protein